MMHEDEFKPIQETYRLLRKEGVLTLYLFFFWKKKSLAGVKFPPRDPNEKFMIKFKGITSPVFESGELDQNPQNASMYCWYEQSNLILQT
mgnify:CR=1 FL=1